MFGLSRLCTRAVLALGASVLVTAGLAGPAQAAPAPKLSAAAATALADSLGRPGPTTTRPPPPWSSR